MRKIIFSQFYTVRTGGTPVSRRRNAPIREKIISLLNCIALIIVNQFSFPLLAADAPPPDFKSAYRVINVHLHCAAPTEENLRAEFDVDDRVGVSSIVILDGGAPAGSLPKWIELKKKFPTRLIVFYKLRLDRVAEPTYFTDIVREIEDAAKQGIQGVKVWKDFGMFNRDGDGKLLAPDDPRFDPFWAKCAELKLPLLWHSADPREYWFPLTYNSVHYGVRKESDQYYKIPEMPMWEVLLLQREHVMKRHPNLIVIGAHMGSMCFDLERLARTFDAFSNFYVDTAARLRVLGRLNPPAIRDFFTKYQDRILFGTDTVILSAGRKNNRTGNIFTYPADDPNCLWIDTNDRSKVKQWQDRSAFNYGQGLQYFETDHAGLEDPVHSGGPWLRFPGVKLPPQVLEKVYHANAERIIPGLR